MKTLESVPLRLADNQPYIDLPVQYFNAEIRIACDEDYVTPILKIASTKHLSSILNQVEKLPIIQKYENSFATVIEASLLIRDWQEYRHHPPSYRILYLQKILNAYHQQIIILPSTWKEAFFGHINGWLKIEQPKPGFVYVLKGLTQKGHYKIGYSKNPEKRINTLGVKLPFEEVQS